jgi:hypothetical protein
MSVFHRRMDHAFTRFKNPSLPSRRMIFSSEHILQALWDELSNYGPIPYCFYGSMKTINEYFHHEYVFQFLMGLNDSFSHFRGQILLIDPLPPINRLFALVLQEERQREASASIGYFSHNSAAMMSKVSSSSPNTRSRKPQAPHKVKPICIHCGIVGHTVEKCYRVHGYPPGFKFTKNIGHFSSANTVQDSEGTSIAHLSIIQEQCQHLLALLKPPSSNSSPAAHQVGSSNHPDHIFLKVTGNFFSLPKSLLNKQHYVFFIDLEHFLLHPMFLINTLGLLTPGPLTICQFYQIFYNHHCCCFFICEITQWASCFGHTYRNCENFRFFTLDQCPMYSILYLQSCFCQQTS